MLKKLFVFYFFLTALTSLFYNDYFRVNDGVYIHGLVGILGFAITGYLAVVVNKRNFPSVFGVLDKIYFYLSLVLMISIFLKNTILITIISFIFLIFTIPLMLRYNPPYAGLERFFVKSSFMILFLDWIYFIYSLNFEKFFMMQTKFSYNYLSFSFPLSLILFSEFIKYLKVKKTEVIFSVLVLVGGVLLLFFGMLLKSKFVEIFSASILLCLIVYYFIKSGYINEKYLFFNFMGLLLTGIFGFWYLLTVFKSGGDRIILLLHAHFAHYAWATFGLFFLFVKDKKIRFLTILFLLLSLIIISVYFVLEKRIFLYVSFIFFLFSGIMYLAFQYKRGKIGY